MSDKPAKRIVEFFQREATQFSQDLTAETFVALSKAYSISGMDNNSQLDQAGYQLFFSP